MEAKLHNNWEVIGMPAMTEKSIKATLRIRGNDPKEVAEDIATIAKFASNYRQIEAGSSVIEVEISGKAQFKKLLDVLASS